MLLGPSHPRAPRGVLASGATRQSWSWGWGWYRWGRAADGNPQALGTVHAHLSSPSSGHRPRALSPPQVAWLGTQRHPKTKREGCMQGADPPQHGQVGRQQGQRRLAKVTAHPPPFSTPPASAGPAGARQEERLPAPTLVTKKTTGPGRPRPSGTDASAPRGTPARILPAPRASARLLRPSCAVQAAGGAGKQRCRPRRQERPHPARGMGRKQAKPGRRISKPSLSTGRTLLQPFRPTDRLRHPEERAASLLPAAGAELDAGQGRQHRNPHPHDSCRPRHWALLRSRPCPCQRAPVSSQRGLGAAGGYL